MTNAEARTRVDLLLDKAGGAYFTDAEKDEFLDMAVVEYITARYNRFELNQKISDELSPFIQEQAANVGAFPATISTMTDLPNYMFLLWITDGDREQLIKKSNVDQVISRKSDPFNNADANNWFWYLDEEGDIVIEGFPNAIGNLTFNVYFIQRPDLPSGIGVSANMPGHIPSHFEMCEIAVRKMLAATENPRYQVQMNEIRDSQA